MENTSPQVPSENAHQLTMQTEDEEQVNFTFGDRKRPCTHCGNVADHKPRTPKCPAFNKTCSQCGIQHHFGRDCLKRPPIPGRLHGKRSDNFKVQYVHDSSDDESYVFQVSPKQVKTDISVIIEGAPVQVCIDSGATANTIDYTTYERISAIKTLPLKPTDVRLRPYGEDNPAPIPLAGSFFGLVTAPSGQMDITRFLVLKARNAGCLLSRETSTRLVMLHVAASATMDFSPISGDYHYLLDKFPAVFSGEIGKLKDYQLELSIDPTDSL